MIETDEIDEDYFAPAPNESLANIFQKESHTVKSENDSLKYVAPKPNNAVEETKTTECIFACAVTGFEWYNNVYTPKGKIGFALMKILKTGICNIILYDSNKSTLSCTTISPQVVIKVKEDAFISYYDNTQKYWSIYGNSGELKDILKHLETLGASIDKSAILADEEATNKTFSRNNYSEVEDSDTDSSVKRKSKASILNRMAHMGHAILPPLVTTEKHSDSSDTSDIPSLVKSSRHKVSKFYQIKDHSVKIEDPQSEIGSYNNNTSSVSKPGNSMEPIATRSFVSQLLPITNTSSFVSDLNVLMSEQRINNNEIRINMARISDKVDQAIHKISDLENKTNSNSFTCLTNEIFRKLLNEYENKIKYYEKIIKAKDIDFLPGSETSIDEKAKSKDDITQFKDHNALLLEELERKNGKILHLENQIQLLMIEVQKSKENHKSLTEEIKQKTEEKINKIATSQVKSDSYTASPPETTIAIENIVKNIINDTFQNAVDKFEENKNYSGKDVKSILGVIMRKVTLKHLGEK